MLAPAGSPEALQAAIAAGADIEHITASSVHESIGRAKSAPNDSYRAEFDRILASIRTEMNGLIEQAANDR